MSERLNQFVKPRRLKHITVIKLFQTGNCLAFSCRFFKFVEISVPSKYVVAASGFPEKTLIDGERTTYSYSLGGGRDFAFVLSDKYNVSSEKCGDVDLYYYSLTENNKNSNHLFTVSMFLLCDKFGKYPHKTFSVAETDFAAGGMEYSGLTMLSDDLDEETLLLATVHETAHQWWHSAVGVNEVEDAYIDEGLCEYSTYLYLLENGMEKQAEEMKQLCRRKSRGL